MGCVSSTQVITDPVTGEVKTKKKNGGAYPGQRGQQHAPYQPPASAFQNGKAVAHFVSYGGGNALTLMQPDGSTKPQRGGGGNNKQHYVQVTLPEGVKPGQKIKVLSPVDERLNEIIIPDGFGPGSTFTVEFAPESEAPPPQITSTIPENDKIPVQQAAQINNTRPTITPDGATTPYATATPTTTGVVDDGFASGFNNPNWTPAPVNDTNHYPTSQAIAVAPTTTTSTSGPYATAKPNGP